VSHQLAYADAHGRIHLVDADTRAPVWTSKPGPPPTQIAWEPSGRQVVAVSRGGVRVLHARDGSLFKQIQLAQGSHQLAVSPTGPAAVTTRSASGQSSILLLHPVHPWLAPRSIFRGAGRFDSLAWSPDGKWLLASWASADEWVFIKLGIRTGAIEHVQAVSSIAPEFDSERPPSLAGWCCAAGIAPP
jgi:WD40 repeat protein